MLRVTIVSLVLGVVFWTGLAAGRPLPAYLVKFTADPIRADGVLDEPAWATAAWSDDFVWIDTGEPAPRRCRFKALYNQQGLHFAFACDGAPPAGQPLDPDFPYACEVFLDPDGRGRDYLEYAVAPDGAQHAQIWHGRLSMAQWSSTPYTAARAGVGTGLVYEVSFPWGDFLRRPGRGAAWRADFSRVEAGQWAGDYAWAPATPVYYMHQPGIFGWLVFAGEQNPLAEIPTLHPQEDVTLQIRGSRRFPLWSRVLWAKWLEPVASGGFLAASKTYVVHLTADGQTQWQLTRTNGLPQFIRSIACVGDQLYLAGNGIGAGLVAVAANGSVQRVSNLTAEPVQLLDLRDGRALATVGKRWQLITRDGLQPPLVSGGAVRCATGIGHGVLALGTDQGFECRDARGELIGAVPIAGGISAVVRLGDEAIGVSGKSGLYRLTAAGRGDYYPRPLRTKFDGVYADAAGRCWATYWGGVARIEKNAVQIFDQPLGIAGFQVFGAAALPSGGMVFAARIPNADWYASTVTSPFLLVYDGRGWRQFGFREGLPAQFNAIKTVNGQIYLCSNAGIFHFDPS